MYPRLTSTLKVVWFPVASWESLPLILKYSPDFCLCHNYYCPIAKTKWHDQIERKCERSVDIGNYSWPQILVYSFTVSNKSSIFKAVGKRCVR
jgi:hypothetical protein